MADGKVSIDVDLNEEKARKEAEKLYKEYEKQTRELEKQREYLQKLERRYERLGNTAQRKIKTAEDEVKRQTTALNKQEKVVASLQKKYDQIASGGRSGTVLRQNILNATVDVQLLEKEFDKLREVEAAALERLKAAQAQRDSGKTITDPDAFTNWDNVEKQVDALSAKIHEAESKVAALQERLSVLKMNSENSEEAKKLKEEIAAATEKMQEYEAAVKSAKDSLSQTKEAAEGFTENSEEARILKEEISYATEKVEEYEATVEATSQKVASAYEKIRENANSVNQSLENTTGYLSASKSIIEAIGDASKKASEVMYNVFDSVTHRLYVMIRRRLFYYALWGTIDTIIDGIKELAETDDDVNNTVSQLYSSIEYLKNSLINSFLPVLEAITPLLTTIIDAVADLVNILGKLFAVLTGNDFTAVTKETLDYAASLDEAEESAEKALAAFDELNILDFGDDEDSSSSSSGNSDDDDDDDDDNTWNWDWLDNIPKIIPSPTWDPDPVPAPTFEALEIPEYDDLESPQWVPQTIPAPTFEELEIPEHPDIESPQWVPQEIPAPTFEPLEIPEWTLESPQWEPQVIEAPQIAELEIPEWIETLQEVMENLSKVIDDFVSVSLPGWMAQMAEALQTTFEALPEYFELFVEAAQTAFESVQAAISGFAEGLETLKTTFSEAFTIIVANAQTFGESIYEALTTTVGYFKEVLAGKISEYGNSFISGLQYMLNAIADWGSSAMSAIYDTMSYIYEVIASIASPVFTVVSTILTGIGTALVTAGSSFISTIAEILNSIISYVKAGVSAIWQAIKSLFNDDDDDDSGSSSGGNVVTLTPITESSISWSSDSSGWGIAAAAGLPTAAAIVAQALTLIPGFAQGAVIEPNHEFAAILGDNKVEQEIVSPLSTMKEAFTEALNESGMTRSGNISLSIDGTEFARITYPYNQAESSRRGNSLIRSGAR